MQYTRDKHGDIAVYFCILYSPRIYLRLGLSFATLIRAVIETKSGRSRRRNLIIERMGISDWKFLYLILKYYLGGCGCTTVFITRARYKHCPIPIDSQSIGTVKTVSRSFRPVTWKSLSALSKSLVINRYALRRIKPSVLLSRQKNRDDRIINGRRLRKIDRERTYEGSIM